MFNPKKKSFIFTAEQESLIIKAIRDAEERTTGEIRVHVEPDCKGDPFERGLELFTELEMYRTQLHNGVLFYLAYDSHKFAIIADSGINQKVPENFWEEIKDLMKEKFIHNQFLEGLTRGITLAGEQLKNYFPQHPDQKDSNELSDELSKS